jgi:hypothetical protein
VGVERTGTEGAFTATVGMGQGNFGAGVAVVVCVCEVEGPDVEQGGCC